MNVAASTVVEFLVTRKKVRIARFDKRRQLETFSFT